MSEENKSPEVAPETEKPKKGKAKAILAGLAVFGFVGFKLAAHFGLGVGVAELQISHSKFETWPKEFKDSFTEGCEESMSEALQKSTQQAANVTVVKGYCGCVVDRVESAHILRTKYNKLTETEESLAKKMTEEVEKYVASAEGSKATEECMQKAVQIAEAGAAQPTERMPASK